jgi:hypothetical protein
MRKSYLHIVLLLSVCACSFGSDLTVTASDMYVTQGVDGGYHLFVRKKPDIGSILITESTADPAKQADSFAYRNKNYHPVNGDEKRMLDGAFIPQEKGLYSLIDSTPELNEQFGEAYHIYIPYILVFGYPWSREGEIQVLDGTYLNIRAFEKPFGDYSGGFADNPFILRLVQKPLPGPPSENYMKDTVESFKEITEKTRGDIIYSTGEADVLDKIKSIVAEQKGKSLDLVLALDTTQSMENDIPYLQKNLIPLLEETTKGFERFRFGMVLYKDYMEEYVTRVEGFKPNLLAAKRFLDSIRVFGGRDIPEAVYEALYDAIHGFSWEAENKLVILIGDAPPHPKPRGKITKDMVYADAESLGITINAIILPQ